MVDYEQWRDIPGYEGRYQASTDGRIKSLSRKIGSRPGRYKEIPERIMAQNPTKGLKLYYYANLREGGISTKRSVHKLDT